MRLQNVVQSYPVGNAALFEDELARQFHQGRPVAITKHVLNMDVNKTVFYLLLVLMTCRKKLDL